MTPVSSYVRQRPGRPLERSGTGPGPKTQSTPPGVMAGGVESLGDLFRVDRIDTRRRAHQKVPGIEEYGTHLVHKRNAP